MSTILVLLFLCLGLTIDNLCSGSYNKGCIEGEREALLVFKHDLIDDANRLASWTGLDEDCCGWVGVVCDNVTGHVVGLHLGNPHLFVDDPDFATKVEFETIEMSKLRGKINPSLLKLKHLHYLDLSNNAFGGIPIPKFLGSIKSLRHLNLSTAGFGGLVPHQLGNLSSLQYLNLFADYEDNFYVANLQWLSGLSLLEHLDLGYVNLQKASNWLEVLNTLPSLEKIYLSNCQLPQVIPPPPNLNLSSLSVLDLSANSFKNPSVGWVSHLKTLISLDLSENNLVGYKVHGLENMTSLRHLDLSCNSFRFPILDWLCNLNSLQFLNLGYNHLQGEISSTIENMTSLRHLDLSFNNFNSSIPISLYNLKSLQFLNLRFNNLKGEISSAVGNLTSAINIDFSMNIELEGGIPRSMGNLCNLKSVNFTGVNLSQNVSDILEIFSGCVSKQLVSLDLTSCQIYGQLTDRLRNFKELEELNLINNSISGPIPLSIGELLSLRVLRLCCNKLNGELPESIGQLAKLEIIGFLDNLLDGVVSEIHFAKLTRLKALYAPRNLLIFKFNPDWVPPFQLKILGLRNCDVGSQFPPWLHSQKYLYYLDMSNSMISDIIPSWFWDSLFQFKYLNLSHNQLHGQIPNLLRISSVDGVIDFSFNGFSGSLPPISSNISFLDLSRNSLSGSLFPLLCFNLNETMKTEILNLGENFLSGEIPDCWMKWQHLKLIRLDSNNLTGRIPSSMGSLNSLRSLKLRKNNFFGDIPLSLKNCTYLSLLDLGENELHGNITKWLVQGHSLSKLEILILRSNKFWGHIPDQLCAFTSLQILDLANNNLAGSLPRCIANLIAMGKKVGFISALINLSDFPGFFSTMLMMRGRMKVADDKCLICFGYGFCSALLMMKGQMLEYSRNVNLVRSIDVSNNKFSGEIPIEVSTLSELQSLNLSHNLFTGTIPESIGVMRSVESLDFSENKLSGSIPPSMSNLTFLNHLNLSCNNLIGEIPSSTQLQSFDPSSYGSNQLCGLPLPHKCSPANGTITPNIGDEGGESDNGFDTFWFWFCLGLPFGFVVGFWIVVGPFLTKRRLCCGIHRIFVPFRF